MKKTMKQKLMLILAIILVLTGVSVAYKFIGTNDLRSKTHEFLETKGYTQDDISDMEIKHSFVNKLLGYNEWRIFVEFESEPEIIFAFTYRNQEIIREGVAGKEPLDKEAILEYENKFDHGKL